MNLLIGLSISNIRTIFEGSGVTRLRLTGKHLHMLEQVFAKLSFLPSIRKRASLLEHLADLEGKREKPSAIVLYVFPNSKDRTGCLKDSGGVLQKTSFSLPTWIMKNLLQLLKMKEERKKEEMRRDALDKEKREMAAIKKEVKATRREV